MRTARLFAAFLVLGALVGCAARRPASPRFTFVQRDLPGLAAQLPADAAAAMRAEPGRFLDLLADALASPEGTLWLVDKAHGLDPAYEPDDLGDLAGRGLELSKSRLRLRAVALDDLLAMSAAARADGVTLVVSSTYRSFDQQGDLWRAALASQPRAVVERELAPPGHSQHQLGTVIDFGSIDDSFAATDAGRWMADNAWRFGWSLSYPEGHEERDGLPVGVVALPLDRPPGRAARAGISSGAASRHCCRSSPTAGSGSRRGSSRPARPPAASARGSGEIVRRDDERALAQDAVRADRGVDDGRRLRIRQVSPVQHHVNVATELGLDVTHAPQRRMA